MAGRWGWRRRLVLLLTLGLGLVMFGWQLGTSGLVDETPPLFAASARAMAETGHWLIPHVNGLPRYDKPPLVYWLMGGLYSLPGQEHWNPLGTWAANGPAALATVLVMLALADTLMQWPQAAPAGTEARARPAFTALGGALAFALSPLVLLWGRTAVSDGLFTGLVALSLLLCWRTYAACRGPWWTPWPVLGLAVLTKGPVAVVLVALTLGLFGWLQGDWGRLRRRLRPAAGLGLTALVALPWYGMALAQEGRPFWDSFFGYHNLQRFTGVVNHHLQPWWFFGPVLVVASLPMTPLLLLGLAQAIGPLQGPWSWPWRWRWSWRWLPAQPQAAPLSLGRFAACWLLAVLLFFTVAATKLPSYWLPATPAAGLLIALTAERHWSQGGRWAWRFTLGMTLVLAGGFLMAPRWVPLIQDPELPTLPAELLAAGRMPLAGACFLLAALLAWAQGRRPPGPSLVALQVPLVGFVLLALLPSWSLGDRLRGLPVREMAAALVRQELPGEPVAMVGILKPSLHYYSRRVVLYEGRRPTGLVNLADRLRHERRAGLEPSTPDQHPTVLIVIDQGTAALPHWQGLEPQMLAASGLYRLWRVDRGALEGRALALRQAGEGPTWRDPRPERY